MPLTSDVDIQGDFAPDYSISNQQFKIGLFGYLFLVGGRYSFLWNTGLMEDPHTPSVSLTPTWVPQCRSNDHWQSIWDARQRDNIEKSPAVDNLGSRLLIMQGKQQLQFVKDDI
jgi:hypothetical protein